MAKRGRPKGRRPVQVSLRLSEAEAAILDAARGKIPRARYLRDAGLLAAGEPFSPVFLRGLRVRAPTNDETGLFEAACLALDSKLPAVREAAQARLEAALAHILTTARKASQSREEGT